MFTTPRCSTEPRFFRAIRPTDQKERLHIEQKLTPSDPRNINVSLVFPPLILFSGETWRNQSWVGQIGIHSPATPMNSSCWVVCLTLSAGIWNKILRVLVGILVDSARSKVRRQTSSFLGTRSGCAMPWTSGLGKRTKLPSSTNNGLRTRKNIESNPSIVAQEVPIPGSCSVSEFLLTLAGSDAQN